MNQQAEPQAESAPTCAELRQDANTARNWSGSRASSQPPCTKVCSTLVTTSVTRARRIGSSPGSAVFAALTSTLVSAKAAPVPPEKPATVP